MLALRWGAGLAIPAAAVGLGYHYLRIHKMEILNDKLEEVASRGFGTRLSLQFEGDSRSTQELTLLERSERNLRHVDCVDAAMPEEFMQRKDLEEVSKKVDMSKIEECLLTKELLYNMIKK